MSIITALTQKGSSLSQIGAGIIAAAHLGIAHDSKTFASNLGIAHALVLRECVALGEDGWLTIDDRQERSGRLFLGLTKQAHAHLDTCGVT